MLEFVTKSQYWQLLDSGVADKLPRPKFPWHLKSIQDAVVYKYMCDVEGKRLAEIGGGDSRLLRVLANKNQCNNIEKFEGQDGGPSHEVKIKNVCNINAFVGEFSTDLEISSFDIIFSVSVVEHISNEDINSFIRDCYRILKPGGQMIHLVDMYLSPGRLTYNESRATCYRSAFSSGLFEPETELRICSEEDLVFKESYCTNPDNVMYTWNQVAPSLRHVRETSQSVTLLWIGKAIK